MGRRLTTFPIWVALAAYFLTGILSARGLQVCLEDDGHVAIETQGQCDDCCAGAPADDGETHLGSCPCVDVPIGSPDSPLPKTKAGDADVDAPAALACTWLAPASHEATRGLAPVRGRAGERRSPLRNAVLRV